MPKFPHMERKKQIEDYLDTIDVSKFLKVGQDLYLTMEALNTEYCVDYYNKTGEPHLFNMITVEEFADYICNRYNLSTYEYKEIRLKNVPE